MEYFAIPRLRKSLSRILRIILRPEHLLLTATMAVSIFASYRGMIEPATAPKRYFTLTAISATAVLLAVKALSGRKVDFNFRFVAAVITALCTEEAVYALCQWTGIVFPQGYYTATAHFDNPAGLTACLCAGSPFALSFWCRQRAVNAAVAMCMTLMFLALAVSHSRTGVIVMSILLANFAMKLYGVCARRRFYALASLVVLLTAVGYLLKRGSADGRMLICRCSMEMIADSPWIGHGIGAFKRLYMDYQASFLEARPDTAYALLADNVLSPFNEYIHLCVCFGMAGLALLAVAVAFLVKSVRKRPSPEKRTALSALYCIGGVSLFSYPFTYPFIWVVSGFILWILLKDVPIFRHKAIRVTLSVGLVAVGIVAVLCLHFRIAAEMRWRQAYLSKDLAEYDRLVPTMGKTPFFLYNYAVVLDNAGEKERSLAVARRCDGLMANYDLELLLGDLYRDNRNFKKSESHYRKASAMCPCRFVPLNQLYDLYLLEGDTAKAVVLARQVVNKTVKVKSRTVTQIRYKMRQALLERSTNPY